MSTSKSTLLNVEDDEQRENRIGSLLEQLNATSSSKSVSPDPLLNIGRENPIGPIEPPAELISRVQDFISSMAAANEALLEKRPEDIEIENLQQDLDEYIEMHLGLGVFDIRRPRSGSRSVTTSSEAESGSDETSSEWETYSSCSGSEEDSESTSSDDSSDADSDSESLSRSSLDIIPISSRPIKPLPRRVSQQAKLEV